MSKIYLAGPMTGLPDWGFPAFAAAAARLRAQGHTVVSPHEMHEGSGADSTFAPWGDLMRQALTLMLTCDTVYFLTGWAGSRGATLEWKIAQELGFTILYEPQLEAYHWPRKA